jgi:hypothetical protein
MSTGKFRFGGIEAQDEVCGGQNLALLNGGMSRHVGIPTNPPEAVVKIDKIHAD